MGHMQNAAVLDVAARADTNEIDITTRNGVWPYGDIVIQRHVANHKRSLIDKNAMTQGRLRLLKLS